MKLKFLKYVLVAASLTLALVGCGGGGGDESPVTPPKKHEDIQDNRVLTIEYDVATSQLNLKATNFTMPSIFSVNTFVNGKKGNLNIKNSHKSLPYNWTISSNAGDKVKITASVVVDGKVIEAKPFEYTVPQAIYPDITVQYKRNNVVVGDKEKIVVKNQSIEIELDGFPVELPRNETSIDNKNLLTALDRYLWADIDMRVVSISMKIKDSKFFLVFNNYSKVDKLDTKVTIYAGKNEVDAKSKGVTFDLNFDNSSTDLFKIINNPDFFTKPVTFNLNQDNFYYIDSSSGYKIVGNVILGLNLREYDLIRLYYFKNDFYDNSFNIYPVKDLDKGRLFIIVEKDGEEFIQAANINFK